MQEPSQNSNISIYINPSNPNTDVAQNHTLTNHPQTTNKYRLIIIFILVGFYFLIFGIIQLTNRNSQKLHTYGLVCQSQDQNNMSICSSEQSLFLSYKENDIVGVYITVDGICEHDIYMLLRNQPQIVHSLSDFVSKCGEYGTNQAIGKMVSVTGKALIPNDTAIPCGYLPSLFPQGTLKIIRVDSNVPLTVITQQLIQTSQTYTSFLNPNLNKQWIDLTNPHFQSWMQNSASIKMNKYWGYISQQISGNYKILYELKKPHLPNRKYTITLQNNKDLGGFNFDLCIIDFVFAFGMFVAALLSFLLYRQTHSFEGDNLLHSTVEIGSKKQRAFNQSTDWQWQNSIAKFDTCNNNNSSQNKPFKGLFRNPFSSSQEQKRNKQVHLKIPKIFKQKKQQKHKYEEQDSVIEREDLQSQSKSGLNTGRMVQPSLINRIGKRNQYLQ